MCFIKRGNSSCRLWWNLVLEYRFQGEMEDNIMMNDREMIEYLKKWNADLESFDDEEEGIAVHNRFILLI